MKGLRLRACRFELWRSKSELPSSLRDNRNDACELATIIELQQKDGVQVSYNDPYFPFVGKGRRYDQQMKCVPVENLGALRLRAYRDRPLYFRLPAHRARGTTGGYPQRY